MRIHVANHALVIIIFMLATWLAALSIKKSRGWGSEDPRKDDCYGPSSLISWMHEEIQRSKLICNFLNVNISISMMMILCLYRPSKTEQV